MTPGVPRNALLAMGVLVVLSAPSLSGRAQQGGGSADAAWTAPSYKSRQANPVTADSVLVEKGKKIYMQQCLVCHGSGGQGDGPAGAALQPPAADLTDSVLQSQSDGALFWKISTGRAPMPAFEAIISEEDRWNIVNYIRSLVPEK